MIDQQTLAPPRRTAGVFLACALVGVAFWLGRQVVAGGPMVRVAFALAVMAVLAVPAMRKPRAAVLGLFIVLPFLGMIRHMFISATGAAYLDPLLLITSAVALTLFISLTLNHEMDFGGTALSKLVFFLLLIGLLQVINPGQGETVSQVLLVGLTGVMINLIPIGFFFIARSISDADYTHKVFRIVLIVGSIAAAYGLVQVFIGFRGFERSWIATNAYGALRVGETYRPFSIFNNASEFASYAHLAFCAAFASLLFARKGKRPIMLGLAVLIGYSGFLIGSRGFTIKVGLALIVLLAARAKHRLLAAGIVIILTSLAVFWSATTTSDARIEDRDKGASQLIEQQLRALRDPFDRTKSTLPVHWEQATEGIHYAITSQPAGLGTGVPTRAGAKFGGLQAGTELDIGDAFLALGVIGGVLYVLVILISVTYASRVRRALPGPVWVGIWAMAATSIGAWLVGGNYAITPLIWFMLGCVDGAYKRLRDRKLLDKPGFA